jgi:hypothetical protein
MGCRLLFPIPFLATSLACGWAWSAHADGVVIPVCTDPAYQANVRLAPDGAGGALVSWFDARGNGSAFVHHLLASDAVDPAWPVNGVQVATGTGYCEITSDGDGGAIVAWSTEPVLDIYAHHVLASGVLDPAWPAGGRAIAVVPNNQLFPRLVGDGAGGAIIAWFDNRNSATTGWDIYAQRVLASGAIAPGWPANGLGVCTLPFEQWEPDLVSDGAGGAIIAWEDARNGSHKDIYAQRVRGDGTFDPSWPANGRLMCGAPYGQTRTRVVDDGAGGAIVTWSDQRNGSTSDVYAMRVMANGHLGSGWANDGEALGAVARDQNPNDIVSDGAGGAVVAWTDDRNGPGNVDVSVGRITASGNQPWTPNGVLVCTAVENQALPHLAADGVGGYFIAWQDQRGALPYGGDIYLQHLLASGAADPGWPANGTPITTTGFSYMVQGHEPELLANGAGAALLAWDVPIDHIDDDPDVFAMHLGVEPCVAVDFELRPSTLNLRSMGHWVTGTIEVGPPLSATDIDVASIRLNGSVPVDPAAPIVVGDADNDGRSDLQVKFDRSALELKLEEGDAIEVTVSGEIAGHCFAGSAFVRVKRGNVTEPAAGIVVQGGSNSEVRWNTPPGVQVQSVAVLRSEDDGMSWTLVANELPNSGSYAWTVPNTATHQARVAVVLVESASADGFQVEGVLGTSAPFEITAALAVGGASADFALGAVPNPSRGLDVTFSLPHAGRAEIAVYDVTGREMSTREVGALGPGRHGVSLAAPGTLAPGIYLVHLVQGDRRRIDRAVVVR